MTDNVFSGTLNPTQSVSRPLWSGTSMVYRSVDLLHVSSCMHHCQQSRQNICTFCSCMIYLIFFTRELSWPPLVTVWMYCLQHVVLWCGNNNWKVSLWWRLPTWSRNADKQYVIFGCIRV